MTASSVCSFLFVSTAFAVGICFQIYDVAFGAGGNLAAMSLGFVLVGALLTLPFSLCFMLPMVLLGWLPCKMSNQTLLAAEDHLESQPMITTRTFLGAFVVVAVFMAILVKIMQVRGVTVPSLFKNAENNISIVRNLLVLAVTFYLTWAYAYLQWALGGRNFSSLLRVFSACGLVAAHSAVWLLIAYLLPFTDPIFDCDSSKLKLKEVFVSSTATGIVLSLSPILVFWILRKAGFRMCYRGKPIGDAV
ncbi:MAG: hypothetical protein NTY15_17140 [Planctomycetota bacterium]|nr:hypothetical protein [Planctomycetota bacterium]